MDKETTCILDRYNLTPLMVAYYYFSAFGVFPVAENLRYQYSTFIPAAALNISANNEFALIQEFAGAGLSTFSFGSVTYDINAQNDHEGFLLDRVISSTGTFMIHVFKYV